MHYSPSPWALEYHSYEFPFTHRERARGAQWVPAGAVVGGIWTRNLDPLYPPLRPSPLGAPGTLLALPGLGVHSQGEGMGSPGGARGVGSDH